MIDLTPLDVRTKRGDFKRILRGYDPQEVDVFLELVAERLEALVRDTIQMRERTELLQQQLSSSTGRERAVQEALVTAQELRADIRDQAQREAELLIQEAQAEARRRVTEIERKIELLNDSLRELERRRGRYLKSFRQLLERELDDLEVEEARAPLEEHALELHLGGSREERGQEAEAEEAAAAAGAEVAVAREEQASEMDPDAQGEATAARILAAGDADEPLLSWDASVHDLAAGLVPADEEDAAAPRPPERRSEKDIFSLPDIHLSGEREEPGER